MRKRIVIAMALGLMGTATAALAGAWYQARSCIAFMGGCSTDDCERSDNSPAQIVENNGGISSEGNSITDGPNGEVDVTVQNDGANTFILFRTKKACQAFIAPDVKEHQEEEQKEEKENHEMEKQYN
jgi:hypothetical protein